jgi:uncharacterized protein
LRWASTSSAGAARDPRPRAARSPLRAARWPLRAALRAALRPLHLALALTLALAAALAGCNSLFFQPNRFAYVFPEQFGLTREDVSFASADGTQLSGWFLPAQGRSRGTVVFFHGNAANISNHLLAVRWLPRAGYAVLLFDYRGYGNSQGAPSRAGLVQDGVAAIRYARSRADVDPRRLVVFGQSLGGAVAISALARAGTDGVGALVIEAGFGSYREEARRLMNEHWYLWPLQYPVAYLFISDELRPFDDLPALAAVPLLVIHSREDSTVPFANGEELIAAFPGPDKTFWEETHGSHIATFIADNSPWRARLVAYLDGKLGPLPAAP